MTGQFIPSVWPILLPILIVVGLPISVFFYCVLSRLVRAEKRSLKTGATLAAISIGMTVVTFCLTNFFYWRWTERTTPVASDLRAAAQRRVSTEKLVSLFGEPSDREESSSGSETFVYSAIIKYSSGRWSIGTVGVEVDAEGHAFDSWTAD